MKLYESGWNICGAICISDATFNAIFRDTPLDHVFRTQPHLVFCTRCVSRSPIFGYLTACKNMASGVSLKEHLKQHQRCMYYIVAPQLFGYVPEKEHWKCSLETKSGISGTHQFPQWLLHCQSLCFRKSSPPQPDNTPLLSKIWEKNCGRIRHILTHHSPLKHNQHPWEPSRAEPIRINQHQSASIRTNQNTSAPIINHHRSTSIWI